MAARTRRVTWALAAILLAGCAESSPALSSATTRPEPGPSPTAAAPAAATAPDTASSSAAPRPATPTTSAAARFEWEQIGTSVLGRPILATTFGQGDFRLFVLGGIHGDERAGADMAPLLADHLLERLPRRFTVRLVLDANPDGTIAATRANANGVDLNRNWPTEDFSPDPVHGWEPLSQPESAALASDLEAFDPDLILALHSTWDGPFVNFDGQGHTLAVAFAEAAATVDPRWTVVADLDWGTPGSLGTYYGDEIGIPVITTEPNRYDTVTDIWPALQAGVDAMLRAFADQRSISEQTR